MKETLPLKGAKKRITTFRSEANESEVKYLKFQEEETHLEISLLCQRCPLRSPGEIKIFLDKQKLLPVSIAWEKT